MNTAIGSHVVPQLGYPPHCPHGLPSLGPQNLPHFRCTEPAAIRLKAEISAELQTVYG